MKKTAIFVFLLGSFLGFAQHTKKKVYKKPIKKTYTKRKSTTTPITATITTESVNQTEQPMTEVVENSKVQAVPIEKPEYETTAEKIAEQRGWINNRNSALVRGVEAFIKGVYSADGKIFFLLKVDNRSNIPYELKNITFVASPRDQKTNREDDTRDEKNFMPIWSNKYSTKFRLEKKANI